jgi:hypothetical protein
MEMSESETNKEQQPTGVPLLRRVAIIGAGYAGLSLANLLVLHASKKYDNNGQVDVVLIEALHPPTPAALVGNVRVPNAKLLFQRLGWSYPWGGVQQQRQRFNVEHRLHADGSQEEAGGNESSPTTNSIVPEDELIQALRRPVESKILHRHVCCKVEAAISNDKQIYMLLRNRETASTFRYPHSIDVLVVCTGASSKPKLHIPSSLQSRCILVLGDARALVDLLGQHRIQQGANQAMQDAMDVSDMLSTGGTTPRLWGRFGLRAKRRAMMQVRVCVVLLVAILVFMFRYHQNNPR